MAKKTAPLLPSGTALLNQFGERLRLARLRRGLSAKQVCERSGMTPMTLRSLERGGSGVTIGAYLAVMQVLGIEQDLRLLADADPIGRTLQDARLLPAERAGTRQAPPPPSAAPTALPSMAEMRRIALAGDPLDEVREVVGLGVAQDAAAYDTAGDSATIGSHELADLLGAPPPVTKPG